MNEKKVLLIQFREDISTDHEVTCFKQHLNLTEEHLDVLNIFKDVIPQNVFEYFSNYKYVILGGSGQYNLSIGEPELLKALEKSSHLIDYLLDKDIPTLGVCFGHQLIAQTLGAKVEKVSEMAESGTFEVSLTDKGKTDDVLKNLPETFYVTLGHKDSVINPSEDLVVLAKSERCPYQAFKYKNNIYTTQFHPELDIDGLVYRLSLYPEYLKGKSLGEIKSGFHESKYAQELLKAFAKKYR